MAAAKKEKVIYGQIVCPFCEQVQKVFLGVNNKYYIGCRNCGPILATGKSYQDYILDKAKTIKQSDVMGVEQVSAPAANDEAINGKDDVKTGQEKPKKKPLFDF